MDVKDACEQAYNNGYADGMKAAAEKIAKELPDMHPWFKSIRPLIRARILEIITTDDGGDK